MIEQGTYAHLRENEVSSASLAIQQLTAVDRPVRPKGMEHSLFHLTQYALAARDVDRLLAKGIDFIAEALPLSFVVIAETRGTETPFCIRAIIAQDSAAIADAICYHQQTHHPGWRSIVASKAEIHLNHTGKHTYPRHSNPLSVEDHERVTVIAGRNHPFGLLLTGEKDRCLTEDEVRFIRAAADVLAIAIDRIQAQQERNRREEMVKQFLEYRIRERSAQLTATNARLAQSIRQYQQTEAALRRSEKDLHTLSTQLIEVGEQERKRIAGELHDGISQTMSSIKYRLEGALMQFDQGVMAGGVATIVAVIPVIQQAIQEVRRISMDLRPAMLDDIGILAAIEWYCREFRNTYQAIRVVDKINVQECDIDENLKLVIFRVIQEAMHNVAQHAAADCVQVELQRMTDELVLRISDNGKGFICERQPGRTAGLHGLGLRTMRGRVEQTMGAFDITSRPGVGTTIAASWPHATTFSVREQPLLNRVQG